MQKLKIGDKVGMMKVVSFQTFKGKQRPIFKSTNPSTIKLMKNLNVKSKEKTQWKF